MKVVLYIFCLPLQILPPPGLCPRSLTYVGSQQAPLLSHFWLGLALGDSSRRLEIRRKEKKEYLFPRSLFAEPFREDMFLHQRPQFLSGSTLHTSALFRFW